MAAEDKEAFLSRWSRLKKQEQAREPTQPAVPAGSDDKEAQAPALPPVDQLTPESDFAPFMQPKVGEAVRRVALKKLFSDPHFNVPDLNEAYSGDWTGGDPISEEMLKTLNQARTVLFREEEEKEKKDADKKDAETQAASADKPKEEDGTGRQDA
jgi:Protein of unknown function (DUF3306)